MAFHSLDPACFHIHLLFPSTPPGFSHTVGGWVLYLQLWPFRGCRKVTWGGWEEDHNQYYLKVSQTVEVPLPFLRNTHILQPEVGTPCLIYVSDTDVTICSNHVLYGKRKIPHHPAQSAIMSLQYTLIWNSEETFSNNSYWVMLALVNLKGAQLRNSLVVQWLRLEASNAGRPGFDPWSGN